MNTEHMIVRLEDGIFDACETNRQLKELLCGTKKATNQELLQAASQLKSRLAQVERERDEFAECIEKECEELRRPIESFVGMKANAHYVSLRMASVLHRARWKHSDQKGKPSNQYGLYGKYTVIKNATGETVDDCFILRPNKDPVAQKAVLTYADLTHDKQLAADLYKWIEAVKKDAKEDTNEHTST